MTCYTMNFPAVILFILSVHAVCSYSQRMRVMAVIQQRISYSNSVTAIDVENIFDRMLHCN